MNVLAALSVGAGCALATGALLGTLPQFRWWRLRRRAGRHGRAAAWLQQAGVAISPGRFAAVSAGAGLLALLVLAGVTGSMFVALVPSIAVALVPRAFFARRRRSRLREVQASWPDGLRDLVASIASGRSLTQAVNALARHGPLPLREAFARFPELARVLGTAPALEIVKEELADPTSSHTAPY